MKKLKIDISELEAAFSTNETSGMSYSLDLETGKVLMTTEDDRSAAEEFFEETDAEEDENELTAKFEKWLEEYDCPNWQVDNIRDAFNVEREFSSRYISIPQQESHDAYNDMIDFADTVSDDHLKELLSVALNGKGAFRRFKDVLYDYPEQKERYFELSEKRLRDRILEWLSDIDIELES
jgi:hypothetical protein